ncbi:glycerophosphodiester phosphodiesterase [Paenibacillus thalictri]|uniref:Glycerophosphodiester phosphodiesterase n=1 Tax=Paenibacillus thalictri TaxID=2527873 RepID=A0A4Q9DIK5_9BACL|nr:glycerophosphodiester phosphodiesterase [Paenibacillus thalictri]TBL72455.1 glycerophosphodiester phosphodiesterase [Paenibacillus thalictri]
MTFPLITAHTGCMNTPANSLVSLEAGIAAGADVLEVDVAATKEPVAVLQHDLVVELADRGRFKLTEIGFEELKNCDIIDSHGGGVSRITPLAEILPIVKRSGKLLNLDLKDDACIAPTFELVISEDMLDQVFCSGAESRRAAYLQQHYPQLKKLLNASEQLFLLHESDYMEAVRVTCEDALASCCFGINIKYTLCRPELIAHAASLGLPVYVWTVNDADEMKRMMELGVASITTKNVPALAEILKSRVPE